MLYEVITDAGNGGQAVVIADPHIEQIAEDVEVIGLSGPLLEKTLETLHRLRPLGGEVQVRDK